MTAGRPPDSPWFLGVDGGGHKTLAIVGDAQGNLLGVCRTGPSNHRQVGLEAAVREIRTAALGALRDAGGRVETDVGGRVEAAAFCLAGTDLPEDETLLGEALAAVGSGGRIGVWNDGYAVLRAGTAADRGVAVVAGSGINAVGRVGERRAQLPALGPLTGDWGSVADLAREALALTMRAWDGRGEPTALTAAALDVFGAPTAAALVERIARGEFQLDDARRLVPHLLRAAADGDRPARRVVERLAEELAACATAIGARLELGDSAIPVVFGGGTVRAGGFVLERALRRSTAARLPRASVVIVRHEPAWGAYLLALDLAGIDAGAPAPPRALERRAAPSGHDLRPIRAGVRDRQQGRG